MMLLVGQRKGISPVKTLASTLLVIKQLTHGHQKMGVKTVFCHLLSTALMLLVELQQGYLAGAQPVALKH